jgi:preprotein translocase subunit SecG
MFLFEDPGDVVAQEYYKNVRRRTEDVDYWRKRAGWFDDDEAMKEYNSGVYDAYYQLDDDGNHHRKSSGGSSSGSKALSGANAEMAKNGLKILSIIVAFGLCILMFRAIMRRLSDDGKKEKKRSDSKSRSSSKSRSGRSRSRSRSRKADNYELMEEDNKSDTRSKRSSRSKSRTRRTSRSRSRARSRSKSRRETKQPDPKEPVLV